jgi:hypothetical protein
MANLVSTTVTGNLTATGNVTATAFSGDGSALTGISSGAGSVEAWVNFNGTGTVAIRASGGVSSITDGGPGDYTVNFSSAFPDANYASVASCSPSAGPNQRVVVMNFGGQLNAIIAPTTTTCRFSTSALTATADVEYVHFLAVR